MLRPIELSIAGLALKLCLLALTVESENMIVTSESKDKKNSNFNDMLEFLKKNDQETSRLSAADRAAVFTYESDLSDENAKKTVAASRKYSEALKKSKSDANKFAWKDLNPDSVHYRWFKLLTLLNEHELPKKKRDKYQSLVDESLKLYSDATILFPNCTTDEKCDLPLDPDLSNILKSSTDVDELTYVWKAFRDATGPKIVKNFYTIVALLNKAAKLGGFKNAWEMWIEKYEDDQFMKHMAEVLEDTKPLYLQLHAFVRQKLRQVFKGQIRPDGPIPAQLLGDMWAQDWSVRKSLDAYPEKTKLNVTPAIEEQKLTAKDMVKVCEKFYLSIGLKNLTKEFWNNSVFERREGIETACHGASWDVASPDDKRLLMCIEPNMDNLFVIYHELGHIQYFLQYQHHPRVFRDGANPGFHEAVGDSMKLFAANPGYTRKVGLANDVKDDYESGMNFLLNTALRTVPGLPFNFIVDLWRSQVFEGKISMDEANMKWLEYRLKYQGVCPPVKRTKDDFDPGAKYHIPAFVEYIRYFYSIVMQFQFVEALCNECGHKGELHQCQIDGCTKAGKLFSEMLSKGYTVPSTKALAILTKGRVTKLDASSMLKYFKPLMAWLKHQNKNEHIGWTMDDPTDVCPSV